MGKSQECDLNHNFAVWQDYGLFGPNRGRCQPTFQPNAGTRGFPSTLRHFHDSATLR